ncbi:unnamed protein product [Coregonus sp. 'balchen']|nr:unnamed protein product [Coregonus sp. 'balchen']
MEGDTEKETAEEKESDDTELSGEERAGRLHQNGGSSEDDQDLPIMQWGDLSLQYEWVGTGECVRGLGGEEAGWAAEERGMAGGGLRKVSNSTTTKIYSYATPTTVRARMLEVRAALSALKNKLLAEQKEKEHLACSSVITKRKHLECCDLQICSIQQLNSIRTSLNYGIHNLSSELVGHLLIRDQLRTKQDAMLLDVQDLT